MYPASFGWSVCGSLRPPLTSTMLSQHSTSLHTCSRPFTSKRCRNVLLSIRAQRQGDQQQQAHRQAGDHSSPQVSRRQLLGAAGVLCSAAGLLGQPQQALAIFQTPDGFRAQVDRYAGWDATRSHGVVGLGIDSRSWTAAVAWYDNSDRPVLKFVSWYTACNPALPHATQLAMLGATTVGAEYAHAHAQSCFTVSQSAWKLTRAVHMLQA